MWQNGSRGCSISSGIKVVNAVEYFALDEVEREKEKPREIDPPSIVNETNHQNIVASSYDGRTTKA